MLLPYRIVATALAATASAAHAVAFGEAGDISSLSYPRQSSNGSSEWPYGPFSTRGRDIINAKGEAVTWAGVNWPGSGETMVPEGLEWASVEDIIDQIKSIGFNFIRLCVSFINNPLIMKFNIDRMLERTPTKPSTKSTIAMAPMFRLKSP